LGPTGNIARNDLDRRGLVGEGLACRRGERLLFRDLAFHLSPGRTLLLRGPNGSGKSSLLRMLAGLLPPEAGRLSWRGVDITTDPAAYRADLAYLGHLDGLKPQLLVRENLGFWAELGSTPVNGVETALGRVGLLACADMPAQFLSAGQRRRLGLARLLLDPAPLWLLDEPTTSLDSNGQGLVLDLIASHLAAGGLAVISSHDDLALPRASTLTLGSAAPA
jgi:heme exporter protein A